MTSATLCRHNDYGLFIRPKLHKDASEAMDSCKPILSDYLARLSLSPDAFPLFYRRLVSLRFPIEVAEILELRYLSHQLIDGTNDGTDDGPAADGLDEFIAGRQTDMAHAAIHKPVHRSRLLRFMILIRKFHIAHHQDSADHEARLERALADNAFGRRYSRRYGRTTGIIAGTALGSSLLLSPPAVLMPGLAIVFGYLSLDYFYSITTLRREEQRLRRELEEVRRRRVRTVNWKAVVRQSGIILGYTQPHGGEAFRLVSEDAEPLTLAEDRA